MRLVTVIAVLLLLGTMSGGCARVIDSRITVETDPPGAQIYSDGVFVGVSPVDLHCRRDAPNTVGKSIYSPHRIEAVKSGYRKVVRQIRTLQDVDELSASDSVLHSFMGSDNSNDTVLSLSTRVVENRFPVVRLTLLPEENAVAGAIAGKGEQSVIVAASQSQVPLAPERVEDRVPRIDFGTFHAVVIGNNNYTSFKKLRTAENDAIAVAKVLQRDYGFKTTVLLNSSRKEILAELQRKRMELNSKDNLLIYYAGHGWLDDETDVAYWMPVGAALNDPSEWISSSTLTNAVKAIPAKHVMIVADSCYSGKIYRGIEPVAGTKRKTETYWRKISEQRARVVLTSGGVEPVADSGRTSYSSHSVFAEALLKALEENQGVMDGMSLFSKVKKYVVLNAEQTPEYADLRLAGHEGGDFVFVRK